MVVRLQTVFSNSVASILNCLEHALVPQLRSRAQVLLYSISAAPSLPADELAQLVSYFQTLKADRVGCLSAPSPLTTRGSYVNTSCSVAIFEDCQARTFRSTIPGKETPQVGRWHALRKREQQLENPQIPTQGVDWETLWAQKTATYVLPASLQDLEPNDVNTILYFTDDSPEGLMKSLMTFQNAEKLGLVASSTPFVTGRPFTLFHNRDIISTGAVGICLRQEPPSVTLDFPTLRAITGELSVTSVEGNLILSLNDQNPSRLLLNAIAKNDGVTREAATSKDEKYYVAVCNDDKLEQVYTVLSGDPSRGSIALEGESAPKEGARVRIYKLPSASDPLQTTISGNAEPQLQLLTTALDDSFLWRGETDGDVIVLKDSVYACSENGFVVSRSQNGGRGEQPWRSTVPGGRISLRWRV